MFMRGCDNKEPHQSHQYSKRWSLNDLPFDMPGYPDSWNAEYRCPGIETVRWSVGYLHDDCLVCEDCADKAVTRATDNGTSEETFKYWKAVQHPQGIFMEIDHQATVGRLGNKFGS